MSTNNHDERDSSTALTIAAVGGGAVLLWLLLRGGRGGKRSGTGSGHDQHPGVASHVVVHIRADDRVEVDGVDTDLATTVTLARAAGKAHVSATGDAIERWVSKVYYALLDAGVEVWKEFRDPPRINKEGSDATANRGPSLSSPVNPASRAPATDKPRAAGALRGAQAFLADVRNASALSSSQSCPPHPLGGGALVRASFRVPPFLADDVLLVTDAKSNPKGRVYCVAYDTTWNERHLERSGWLDRDTLTPVLEPGMRVALSPLCPLWSRGAKYGTIREVTKNWTVVVKMDDPRVRRLQRFTDHTQLTTRSENQ